ncbi:Bcr/CflA family efflux MFS transporter [Rubrimonas cliftonensis]|uniref:Bcr/CflA family efflux transporter n=1 Tax=Rubrimonas cliftonensis TaxID=89524 RepID=A0A1H4F9R6_9RHOB|nr:Bcr/CflA family efflux MFS transporter [Rubrimonas cliftonensis]SEA94055.1 MFS transporter, DHA1 family, bicyclomycin/chloramphenicol resistance protein [Rubrimonas cliftonensis]
MPDRLRLVALLAALTALGPFAMQSLAPALPMIATSFSVNAEAAQMMLSLSILAIGVSTLLLGPLSDVHGRRPVALASVAVTVVASGAVAIAPTLESAVAARVVQAGAAGAGMVLSRAIARDRFGPEGAGAVIAQVTAVMVLAPMVAPIIGGIIAAHLGWRAIFAATAGLAAVVGWLVWRGLAESNLARSEARGARAIAASLAAVSRSRRFWSYCVVAAMSLSSFLFFVGTAPYVVAEGFGAGPDVYGLGFAAVGAGYIASNLLYARLVGRVRGDMLMLGGLAAAVATSLACGLAVTWGWTGLHTVFAAAVLNSLASGLVVPNAMAGAVASCPERAGASSSLLGFVQFAVAACAAQLGAVIPHQDAGPMSLSMAAISALGLAGFIALSQRDVRKSLL